MTIFNFNINVNIFIFIDPYKNYLLNVTNKILLPNNQKHGTLKKFFNIKYAILATQNVTLIIKRSICKNLTFLYK